MDSTRLDPFGFTITADEYADYAADMTAERQQFDAWRSQQDQSEMSGMEAVIEDAAIRHLGCSLVESAEYPEDRGLDTHDLHVSSLRRALSAAFLAGHAAGRDERYAENDDADDYKPAPPF